MGIDVGSVVREFGRFVASMDWSAVAAVVSAAVAIVAARIARQNAKDAKASAAATRIQADVAYAGLVAASPGTASSDVVLDRVSYRWAADGMRIAAPAGYATSVDGVDSVSFLTRRAAVDKELFAEIVIDGTLKNTTDHEVLVTVRARRQVRYPLQNQGVFVVDGQDRHSMVLRSSPGKWCNGW